MFGLDDHIYDHTAEEIQDEITLENEWTRDEID